MCFFVLFLFVSLQLYSEFVKTFLHIKKFHVLPFLYSDGKRKYEKRNCWWNGILQWHELHFPLAICKRRGMHLWVKLYHFRKKYQPLSLRKREIVQWRWEAGAWRLFLKYWLEGRNWILARMGLFASRFDNFQQKRTSRKKWRFLKKKIGAASTQNCC